jgi:hypothetical protein
LILDITGEVEFLSSNEDTQLCAAVLTTDDEVVEDSGRFVLTLTLGLQNDRITVQPQQSNVTVLDNDSML